MRVIDVKHENLPFSEEEFTEIAELLYQENQNLLNTLEKGHQLECKHIFNQKNIDVLHGFKIEVCFVKNEDTSIGMFIEKLILFDDEDEWIEEYKSLKSLKSND